MQTFTRTRYRLPTPVANTNSHSAKNNKFTGNVTSFGLLFLKSTLGVRVPAIAKVST